MKNNIKDIYINNKSVTDGSTISPQATTSVDHQEAMVLLQDGTLAPLREIITPAIVDKLREKTFLEYRNPNVIEQGGGSYKVSKVRYPESEDRTLAEASTVNPDLDSVTLQVDNLKTTKYTPFTLTDLKRFMQNNSLEAKFTQSHSNRMINDLNYAFYEEIITGTVNTKTDFDITTATPEEAYETFKAFSENLLELSSPSPFVEPGFEEEDLIAFMTPAFTNKLAEHPLYKGSASERTFEVFESGVTKTVKTFLGIDYQRTAYFNKILLNKPQLVMMPKGAIAQVDEIIGLTLEKIPGKINAFRVWAEYDFGQELIWPEFIYVAAAPTPPYSEHNNKESIANIKIVAAKTLKAYYEELADKAKSTHGKKVFNDSSSAYEIMMKEHKSIIEQRESLAEAEAKSLSGQEFNKDTIFTLKQIEKMNINELLTVNDQMILNIENIQNLRKKEIQEAIIKKLNL